MAQFGEIPISRRGACGALLAAALWRPAQAQQLPAGELRIGLEFEPATLDPHFRDRPPDRQIAAHIFEPLLRQGDDGRLAPVLALSWRQRDAAHWQFDLRPEVRFHDGGAFTAEDVAFSIERARRVPEADASFAAAAGAIAEIRVLDPLTLLIAAAVPDTDLPALMARLPIVSKRAAAGPAPEGRPSSDFDSGAAAVGTGPYRFGQWVQGDRLVLTASPDWWGGQAQWRQVVFRPVPHDARRVILLRQGELDLIENPPRPALGGLRRDPDIAVAEILSARLVHVALDASSAELRLAADSQIANPLRDARVREALDLAIDRRQILRNVLQGEGAVATGLAPPQGDAGPPAGSDAGFNPARARKLLADAGLVEGFPLTLAAPEGRFANADGIAREVAGMWARIGVRTTVELLAADARRRPPDESRPAALQAGIDLAGPDAVAARTVLPLLFENAVWASRAGIAYRPRRDQWTLAQNALRAP